MTPSAEPVGWAGEQASLATRIVALASGASLRIAVAESLTGGLLADAIVAVPGASHVFSGGIVAYDTALKHTLLGVDAELLRAHGPVDPQVAEQMAAGVRRACAIDGEPAGLGIATTGVAGPDPDPQTGQPAGTVWVGLSFGDSASATRLTFEGEDRPGVRHGTVTAALRLVIEHLATMSQRT